MVGSSNLSGRANFSMGTFMNTSQPENKNSAGRIVFIAIILCIGYAILRYRIRVFYDRLRGEPVWQEIAKHKDGSIFRLLFLGY